MAAVIGFGLRFLVNLSAFWLLDYRGVLNMAVLTWTFLAGFVVPLSFLPDGVRAVLQALPFAGMVQVLAFVAYYPSLLILDKPDAAAGWPWLGYLTPAVAAVTLLAGRAAWNAGVRHYRCTGS